MIETFDQIYKAFSSQLTRQQYDQLVRTIYLQLYKRQPPELATIEDKVLLKITLIQQLKLNSPTALLEEDLLPLLNESLAVDNDSSLFDKYRCQKCKLLMPQAYKASCGCQLCRKCIQRQYYIKDKQCAVCAQPVSEFKQLKDAEQFVRNLQFICPFCKEKMGFMNIQQHVTSCTARVAVFKQAGQDLVLNQINDKYTFQIKLSTMIDFSLNEGNKYSAFYESLAALINGKPSQPVDESLKIVYDMVMNAVKIPEIDTKDANTILQKIDNEEVEVYKMKKHVLMQLVKQIPRDQKGLGSLFGPRKDVVQKVDELRHELQGVLRCSDDQVYQEVVKLSKQAENYVQVAQQLKITQEQLQLSKTGDTLALEQQIKDLTQKLEETKVSGSDQIKQHMLKQSEEIQKLNYEIKQSKEKFEHLEQQDYELKEQLANQEQVLKQRQQLFDESNSRYAAVEQQFKTETKAKEAKDSELQAVTIEYQHLKQLYQAQLTKNEEKLTEIHKLTESQQLARDELQAIQKSAQEITQLRKYKQVAESFSLKLRQLEGALGGLLDTVGQKQTKTQQRLSYIQQVLLKQIEQQTLHHKTQYKSQLAAMDGLRTQRAELSKQVDGFTAQQQQSQKQAADILQRNLSHVHTIQELKAELAKALENLEAIQHSKEQLMTEHDVAVSDLKNAQQQLQSLKTQSDEEIKQKSEIISQTAKSLAFEEDGHRQARKQLETAQAELNNLRIVAKKAEQADAIFNSKLNQLQLELIFTYKQLIQSEKPEKRGFTDKTRAMMMIYQNMMTVDDELKQIKAIWEGK